MTDKIVTIGVYGFNEAGFFKALLDAKVDTFCDIRLRRGIRGSQYAFVNSVRLQNKLAELGIRYFHLKQLAPSQNTRNRQKEEDDIMGIGKRSRTTLGKTFIKAYKAERLADFNSGIFLTTLGRETRVLALFCVEREPDACHRSLVAARLQQDLGLPVEHLQP